ncbi:hypothetical protein [Lichenibacterium minor]|uniref:hypothetical protein n=1 Tax=Lichenibacterium minor TaxID=2316528 RepID=UPI0013E9E335|nr:hypothetical protein [Lichenibacterium minor]
MSTPIDLGAVRAARDAAVQMARGIAQERVGFIVQTIERHARRAYAGSAAIEGTDPELARAANRWCARKLRSEVRKALRDVMPAAGLVDTVEIANDGFWGRLDALHEAAKAGEGGR